MRAVLTFHGIDDSGSVLSISARALAALLAAVRDRGFAIVGLGELLHAPDDRDLVALTFDDGFGSLRSAALPILQAEDAPATLFLSTGRVGLDNRWPGQPASIPTFAMLGWNDVEALASAGVAIEAHTVSHPDLRNLSDAAIEDELAGCDAEIARRIGRAPTLFAYPYGHLDERVLRAVRRRYRAAVTTELSWLPARGLDLWQVPRLDGFYLRRSLLQRRFGSAGFRGCLRGLALARSLRARLRSAA